ncbi:MAG: site-2 protease family protein [Acidobacteriota bacterium]|nr:site-2 protease family protein [Acidobacteriota bacterium]
MENGSKLIGEFVLGMVAFLFSASVHESAHAWTSSYFGDDLARSQGRISLNPLVHIDPIGTLLFPAIAFFTHVPLIGWAKATPVNPLQWRNKRVANFWVSAAGVICNFIMAIIAGIAIRLLYSSGVIVIGQEGLAPAMTNSIIAIGAVNLLQTFFSLNIVLGVFNLLPVPPLDGSGILSSVLPSSFEAGIQQLHQFGYLLLFIAVFTGVVGKILGFFIPLAWAVVFVGAY